MIAGGVLAKNWLLASFSNQKSKWTGGERKKYQKNLQLEHEATDMTCMW